jgi:alpha-glucosidase (family GH31 glycosyl hydrolase)
MSDYKDFTYDTNAFKGLPDFIDTLHKQNQRFVPIIDAGVAIRPGSNYAAYDEGIKDDVFLKINNEVFIGKVWPNDAAFPDFFNPKTAPWWQK